MSRMLALIGLLGLGFAVWAGPSTPAVTVSIVKYDGLTDAIRGMKGKVVVVDFWADYCVPCKREFPKLVNLNRDYAKKGLAAVSVSLDEVEDGTKDRVLKFLNDKQATFTNFILNEKPDVWQKKLQIDGPPLVFVFNRKGELVKKYVDKDVDYAEIEKLANKLLSE